MITFNLTYHNQILGRVLFHILSSLLPMSTGRLAINCGRENACLSSMKSGTPHSAFHGCKNSREHTRSRFKPPPPLRNRTATGGSCGVVHTIQALLLPRLAAGQRSRQISARSHQPRGRTNIGPSQQHIGWRAQCSRPGAADKTSPRWLKSWATLCVGEQPPHTGC